LSRNDTGIRECMAYHVTARQIMSEVTDSHVRATNVEVVNQ